MRLLLSFCCFVAIAHCVPSTVPDPIKLFSAWSDLCSNPLTRPDCEQLKSSWRNWWKTCSDPDYWTFCAEGLPKAILDAQRGLCNVWPTTCTQPVNTLSGNALFTYTCLRSFLATEATSGRGIIREFFPRAPGNAAGINIGWLGSNSPSVPYEQDLREGAETCKRWSLW
jgi:hypothetical protein